MNFLDKLAEVFGIEYEYEYEEDEPVAIDEPEKSEPKKTFERTASFRIPVKEVDRIRIFEPYRYDDCKLIADEFKAGSIVIVKYNMDVLTISRQIYNFMAGCVYALDGNAKKIGTDTFVYSPVGYSIKDTLDNTGLKTPWSRI